MKMTGMTGLLKESITEPCGLLCCAFGVKNDTANVYFELLKGPKTVVEIARILGRDRSIAQRHLSDLLRNKLVHVEKKPLEQGGYHNVYRANSSEETRDRILGQLEQWYSETRRFLLDSWPTQSQ